MQDKTIQHTRITYHRGQNKTIHEKQRQYNTTQDEDNASQHETRQGTTKQHKTRQYNTIQDNIRQ